MINYIIYGTSLSGMIAHNMLKGENILCFIDVTGKINNDNIPAKYSVYSHVNEVNGSTLSKTESILIAVGNRILAYSIKEELLKTVEGIKVFTVYDDEFIETYLSHRYKVEDKETIEKFNSTEESPKVFGIEVVLGCNLKCIGCQEGIGLIKRKKGLMNYENFKIIIDKIKKFADVVMLHGYGEPMLNPEIIKMIKYTNDNCGSQTDINVSTNGINIDEKMAYDLINSGVKSIIVSMDAVDQEVYEMYRKGGSFEQVISALQWLVKCNQLIGNKVDIYPQFIVFKHNQHQIEAFAKMCKDMGLMPSFKSPFLLSDAKLQESDNKEFIRRKYNTEKELFDAMKYCSTSKNDFSIRLDGSVNSCCFDYNGVLNYGNIYIEDVMEIWEKEAYKNFRHNIINGNIPEFCKKNCMQYFIK